MDMYPQYRSTFGYQTGDGSVDSYGVDHSNFSLRDEIEYQTNRVNRENQLQNYYNNQGITENYPQYGRDFWNAAERLGGVNNLDNKVSIFSANTAPLGNSLYNQPQSTNTTPEQIHRNVFDGINCGGMSADFADKIAYEESRGECVGNRNNYECINKSGSAMGRYQMQEGALAEAKYWDNKKKQFTGKDNINSREDFLNSPLAQEKAMCEFLNSVDNSYKNTKVYDDYENRNIVIDGQHIPLDRNTLLSMGHRWGSSGGRWVLHSTTKDSNGNYLYNPRDCYDYTYKQLSDRQKDLSKPMCNQTIKRVIDLNK